MFLQDKAFYEFGPYRLEPSERLLLRTGQPVSVPPKAFETLLLLVQNSGHVLSKPELMRTLWPDTFVEENNLTQQISQLRRALGEAPEGGAYIETVPRLGYRFAVPVRTAPGLDEVGTTLRWRTRTHIVVHEHQEEITGEQATAEPARPEAPEVPESLPPRAQYSRALRPATITLVAAGTVAAVMAVLLAGITLRRAERPLSAPPAAAAQPRRLAVLPFRNLRPGPESDFLSLALTDAIISRLGYLPEMVVRPASYVVKYRGGETDTRRIAEELRVQAVVTGSYLREGEQLRVSSELVDVAQAEVLWRDSWVVPYGQLLTVQDRVAENVVRGMRLQMMPQTATRWKESAPRNPQAYEYYLRGYGYGAANDFGRSMQMFEKSIEIDPSYAPAWVGLGQAYASYGDWHGGGAPFAEKSKAAFDKALALEPELPVVRTLTAVHLMEQGELEKGLLALREELRRHPNEAFARWWLTEAYLYGGMLEESIAEGERALDLDPLVNEGSTFNSYLHAGNYERFLSTLPGGESARTTFYRGLCFLYMRDPARAEAEFDRAYAMDAGLLHARYGKAFLYAIRHQRAEGLRYLQEMERSTPTADGEMLYKMAQAYAALGDAPSSLRLLRQAIDHNFYCHACFLRDPLLTPLRGEEQYAELMDLASARHEAFKRRFF